MTTAVSGSRKLGPGAPVIISNKVLRREHGCGVFIIASVDDGLARLERQANRDLLGGEIPLSFLQPARLQLGR